jgi:type I restriction enzyme, S subunit
MKRWPTKPLAELIIIVKGKKAPEVFATPTKTSLRYLQIDDLRPNANMKYCEPFNCPRATRSDAIIAWDGANAGTVSCNLDGHIGSTLAILRPVAASTLSAPFLSRFLEGNFSYLQKTATGATIPHVSKGALTALHLPVPPLAEQERIVKLLDEADELRKLRAQADHRAATLLSALFHEMFGENRKHIFERMKLEQIAEVVSGVAKGRKFNGRQPIEVPYLRVANVQAGHLDLTEIKTIQALPEEVKELALRKGDVLLTEGGDFDKLGRGAMLEQDLPNCIHQNHVFRVRVEQAKLEPIFFAKFLLTAEAKGYFLGCAKRTTNLASINMRQLRALPVPLPPLVLQKEFAQRVTEIRELEAGQATSRTRLDALFQSMLHRAFNGDI